MNAGEYVEPAAHAFALNAKRRHLTPGQLAAAVIEYDGLRAAEVQAKERQRESGGDRKSEAARKSVGVNSPQPIPTPAQRAAAALDPIPPQGLGDYEIAWNWRKREANWKAGRAPKAVESAAATVGVSGQTVQRAKK